MGIKAAAPRAISTCGHYILLAALLLGALTGCVERDSSPDDEPILIIGSSPSDAGTTGGDTDLPPTRTDTGTTTPPPPPPPPPAERCANGVDDDGDGAIDCEDSGCANDPACASYAECESLRSAPPSSLQPCTDTDQCGEAEICANDPGDPERHVCQKYCYPDSCNDVCGTGRSCEVVYDAYGDALRYSNNERFGLCWSQRPAQRYELCKGLTCGPRLTCMPAETADGPGWCATPCDFNLTDGSCPTHDGFQMQCLGAQGDPFGTCHIICDRRDPSDCPSGLGCWPLDGDIGVCANPDAVCIPTSCEATGAECGAVPDGCGGTLDCGGCYGGDACQNNQCVCAPRTCAEAGAECGSISDGCGGTLNCGGCGGNDSCQNNQCACTPSVTCQSAGVTCGSVDDGCGNTLNCDLCTGYQTCGGGGVPGQCGCTPTSCAAQGRSCGSISDGCGATLSCGSCGSNSYCTTSGSCASGCEPVDQLGCASGERCIWDGYDEACVPKDPYPTSDGQICSAGDCKAGSACANEVGGLSLCRSYCHTDSDCSGSGRCAYDLNGTQSLGLCSSGCNPLSSYSCASGQACYVIDVGYEREVTDCLPSGYAGDGSYCSRARDCQAGYTCAGSSCYKICSRGSTCPDGDPCGAVQGWSNYGVCN